MKRTPEDRTVTAVDGGMSDNVRPMLYGARYTVALAGPPRKGDPAVVDVVGRHCESGDVLARDVELPAVPVSGDLLAFAGTGAYTYSMASVYNRVGRPAVVAVSGGRGRVWLRREEPADLDRLESGRPLPVDASPPDGVMVRPASAGDASRFLELLRDVAAEERFLRIERVLRSVRETRQVLRNAWSDDRAFLVAAEGRRIVGWLSMTREEHQVTRHVATFGMGVAADRRRRGIGAALLSEALRWARGAGVEKVELSVYPANIAALALYRRFGFVEEGRLARHSRKSYGDEDEILMGVWLREDG